MTTQVLLEAGLDPSAVIGGKLPVIDAYGRYGNSQNFVCESCEFNNTFLHMNADMAVVLNIDEDHLDFFGNLENIKKAFRNSVITQPELLFIMVTTKIQLICLKE